jgi:hypothetical protein
MSRLRKARATGMDQIILCSLDGKFNYPLTNVLVHNKDVGKVTKFKPDALLQLELDDGGGRDPHGVVAHDKRGKIGNVHSSPALPLVHHLLSLGEDNVCCVSSMDGADDSDYNLGVAIEVRVICIET